MTTAAPTAEQNRLRVAALLFALALIVHGADHARRGLDVTPPAVFWAGSLQFALAALTVALVLWRHRAGPVAAIVVGFASAFGFAAAHLLPTWGAFSDSFLDSASLGVTAFSWVTALLEIAADLFLGYAGLRAIRRQT